MTLVLTYVFYPSQDRCKFLQIVFFEIYSLGFSLQIAREMVISPMNSRLGLTALTRRVGLLDRPDSPDGELIKYKVNFSKIPLYM